MTIFAEKGENYNIFPNNFLLTKNKYLCPRLGDTAEFLSAV